MSKPERPAGACSVPLSMTMRVEMGAVPSGWVPEQEDIRNKSTVDPHLTSNMGER